MQFIDQISISARKSLGSHAHARLHYLELTRLKTTHINLVRLLTLSSFVWLVAGQ
jgi:hypothetical protein